MQTKQGVDNVVGANCTLVNDKGTFFVTTPGTVTLHRSYDDLNVKCEKQGSEPGIATVKSTTKGMTFGNILFGGIIGAAVDMGTGAGYDYPTLITVEMGKTITIAPPPGTPADNNHGYPSNAPSQAQTQATSQSPATQEVAGKPSH